MKLEEYQSGKFIKTNDYKAFIPNKINYNWGWDDTKLDKLLEDFCFWKIYWAILKIIYITKKSKNLLYKI